MLAFKGQHCIFFFFCSLNKILCREIWHWSYLVLPHDRTWQCLNRRAGRWGGKVHVLPKFTRQLSVEFFSNGWSHYSKIPSSIPSSSAKHPGLRLPIIYLWPAHQEERNPSYRYTEVSRQKAQPSPCISILFTPLIYFLCNLSQSFH